MKSSSFKLDDTLHHIVLTLKHAGYLKNASSMEVWGAKSIILINAAHELWVGPQTGAISVLCTYTEGLVL